MYLGSADTEDCFYECRLPLVAGALLRAGGRHPRALPAPRRRSAGGRPPPCCREARPRLPH
eukprot:7443616-Alexandrium_andersonii.AAC.1